MSRAQMTGMAVVVGIAILVGVAVNIALVVFSVMSTRDMVRLDSQVRELTSVVAVLKQSLQEASSNQTALASQQDELERSSVRLVSCQQYRDNGNYMSGVYTLYLRDGGAPFPVYCDMQSDGYGWAVFQRRVDGSEDFYRTWADYKAGFGRLEAEFWLGNDKLHRLTSAGLTRLRVDLGDWQNDTAYALYSSFSVAGEGDNYRLNVTGYSGTAGDAGGSVVASSSSTSLQNPGQGKGLYYNSGWQFTTKDRDNDRAYSYNCAVDRAGAWWYDLCTWVNLNGLYGITATGSKQVYWYAWKDGEHKLKSTEMKVR